MQRQRDDKAIRRPPNQAVLDMIAQDGQGRGGRVITKDSAASNPIVAEEVREGTVAEVVAGEMELGGSGDEGAVPAEIA
jgi:hypothetical protein